MSHIKSFKDLGKDKDGDSSDEEEKPRGTEYYAGGQKSGQAILGNPDGKTPDGDKVKSLFDRARESGAVDGTGADLEGPSTFRGTGRTLAGGAAAPGPRNHVITFWSNRVFTVDDGPPRRIDDPENADFINAIGRGECPEELEAGQPGVAITVNLVKKDEEYSEPDKPKYTAFTGSGRTLTADGGGASTSAAAAAAAAADADAGEWEGVDETKPATSLQLRLADGSRMVARFNHTHRVSDVRRFIRASRPDVTFSYVLMTAFPSAPVEDEGKTLEEAGLLNAVLIQKKL
ncbi:hypothetical protein FOA52_003372 [Chlamydomonas sp. UWO 241]|nr:hypothetical protein FOA52_003372 [Chlamydomonas sp. UWO 241]